MYRLILVIVIVFSFGCKIDSNKSQKQAKNKTNNPDKLGCIEEMIEINSKHEEYDKVIRCLQDTISYFVGKSPHSHRPDIVNYKLDELILFDDNFNNCMLFLLEVYPEDYTIDDIRIIRGFKKDSIWSFKLYPVITRFRENNDNNEYSHQQLSIEIRELLIQKGLFKGKNCNLRENYLEDIWFKEFD